MLRHIGVLAVLITVTALAVGVSPAAAAVDAPVLTSAAFASPVTIHWTPGGADGAADEAGGGDRHGHGGGQGHGDKGKQGATDADRAVLVQSVVRAPGACGALSGDAGVIASFEDSTTSDFSDPVAAGTYCYWIVVSLGSELAASPGLTVTVASATVAAAANGSLLASVGVNPSAGVAPGDKVAPPCPGKLSVSLARSAGTHVAVMIRWKNPAASDLERVELLINRSHAPRSHLDGRVIYRGLDETFLLRLPVGQTAHLALYAVDRSGNLSTASRTLVSLARLIPMRPLSGSLIHAEPLLTWKPKKRAAYYNLQVFRQGKRVLVAWPLRASYRVPAGTLPPGTYVWFVWPAMQRTGAVARFADLIGRATFTYTR
jgi:hypothetical protein